MPLLVSVVAVLLAAEAEPAEQAASATLPSATQPAEGTTDTAPTPVSAAEETPIENIEELDLSELLDPDIRTQKITVASKREESVGDAPATVTVLTREDFERHAWRNVAEALRSVPGLYVSWGRDTYSTGVRGLSFPGDVDSRILVLVDGHTMNNPWNASSNTSELYTMPPIAIERVEVIRGPASSVYGSNAFFAVVNIVSRSPTEQRGSRIAAQALASSLNMYRADAAGHIRTPIGLDVQGFATVLLGDGPPVNVENMTRPRLNSELSIPGQTRRTDYERGLGGGLSLTWRGLRVRGQALSRLKGLPMAPGDSIYGDPYNSRGQQHFFVEASYNLELGKHAILFRAYWDRFLQRTSLHRDPSDWPVGAWVFADPRTRSDSTADKVGGEVQGTFALHKTDTLIAGADVTGTDILQSTGQIDPTTGAIDPTTLSGGVKDASGQLMPIRPFNFAGYLQNDWRPIDWFGLVVGARYDYNTVFFRQNAPLAALAPRAIAIFKPLPTLTLKAAYGEAFRYPTVFEAFFDDSASACGNGEIRPERQRTAEASGVFAFARGFNLSASVFYTHLNDLIVRQGVDSCYANSGPRQRYVNSGVVSTLGGEAGMDIRLPMLTAFANVTVAHTQQNEGGVIGRPANSPWVLANAGAAVPLWRDQLFAALRAHLITGRLEWSRSASVPPGLRLEASVTMRRLFKVMSLGVSALTAFKLTETMSGYALPALRDPVSTSDTIPGAVPQNLWEVRGHVGFEL